MNPRLIPPDPMKWLKNRTLPLLIALVGLIALHPLFVQEGGLTNEVFPLIVGLVPMLAVAAIGSWKRALPLVSAVLAMSLVSWLYYNFDQDAIAKGPGWALSLAYYGYAIWALSYRLFRSTSLIDDRVYGGLVIYLLAAMMFASIYRHISAVDHEAFANTLTNAPRALLWNDAVYFSVITISTLGYGDITPRSNWARSAVMIEVLSGVFITVAFITQLIKAKPSSDQNHAR